MFNRILIKSNLFCWCCITCGQNKRHSRELPGGAHIIHISRGRSWGKIKSVRESQFSDISNRWHGAEEEVPLRLKFSPKEKLCKSLLDQSRLVDVSLKLKEILARIVLKIWPERRSGLFLRKKNRSKVLLLYTGPKMWVKSQWRETIFWLKKNFMPMQCNALILRCDLIFRVTMIKWKNEMRRFRKWDLRWSMQGLIPTDGVFFCICSNNRQHLENVR